MLGMFQIIFTRISWLGVLKELNYFSFFVTIFLLHDCMFEFVCIKMYARITFINFKICVLYVVNKFLSFLSTELYNPHICI